MVILTSLFPVDFPSFIAFPMCQSDTVGNLNFSTLDGSCHVSKRPQYAHSSQPRLKLAHRSKIRTGLLLFVFLDFLRAKLEQAQATVPPAMSVPLERKYSEGIGSNPNA